MIAVRQLFKVGPSAPRAFAHMYRTPPARRNLDPAMKKGGRVSMAIRIAR
jgi:hypothetical protein